MRNQKGQFSIIAAVLVSIVLFTAIITTYTLIRNNPLQDRPEILGAIDEMNLAIKGILSFAVGYYGSILEVTGNTTYAKGLAFEYVQNGIEDLAYIYPNWSPSCQINSLQLSTVWFNRTSSIEGSLNLNYSLLGLGIYKIQYLANIGLDVTVNPSSNSYVLVDISSDGKPFPLLSKENFHFYNYSYERSAWNLTNSGVEINSVVSTDTYSQYNITVPTNIDTESYMLQVLDSRGIRTTASTYSNYTYLFDWNQALYTSLNQDTLVVEVLQNGTLKWFGEDLLLLSHGKPIPPIAAKAFHINQTSSGINREVSFQIEDWGSEYRVPAGMTSNVSIFNNRKMLVFLVNHNVEEITLWWDGRDIANQTTYAFKNRYFTEDNPASRSLTNGIIWLNLSSSGFTATSSIDNGTILNSATFLRINNENPIYGADPAYVIHHGVVRDIIQQEAEWSGGISGCPNIYAQIVLTLPANATYYTYTIRLIFVDSFQSRTVNELSVLQLTVSNGQQLTENATSGGYPVTSNSTGLFYNFSSLTGWAHHWSEFISGNAGAGIMFPDSTNQRLYYFDNIAPSKTGALKVTSSGRIIEFNPIEMASASFQNTLDISWHGAVVNFDGTDPIYPQSGNIGLWVMVEHPPTITIG